MEAAQCGVPLTELTVASVIEEVHSSAMVSSLELVPGKSTLGTTVQ